MLDSEGVEFDRWGVNEFVTDYIDGMFVSRRRLPLTRYQKGCGCREVIRAETFRQLVFLAMAERIKADLIALCEQEFEEEHGHPPEFPGPAE